MKKNNRVSIWYPVIAITGSLPINRRIRYCIMSYRDDMSTIMHDFSIFKAYCTHYPSHFVYRSITLDDYDFNRVLDFSNRYNCSLTMALSFMVFSCFTGVSSSRGSISCDPVEDSAERSLL